MKKMITKILSIMGLLCSFMNLELNSTDLPPHLDAPVHPNNYSVNTPLNPTILHILYTGESLEDSLKTFLNPEEEVSVHYLIAENGTIYRLVPESKCAWHAGKSSWGDLTSLNKHSIGVALVNIGITDEEAQIQGWGSSFPGYTQEQIKSLIHLSVDIMKRYNIKPWNVVGHSDIAPDRKFDPGLKFPWKELAIKGIGLWPATERAPQSRAINIKEFFQKLSKFGYGVSDLDLSENFTSEASQKVIAAFQAHYRPEKVNEVIDAELDEILNSLIFQKNQDS